MSSLGPRVLLALSLVLLGAAVDAEPKRFAVLVGIDEYVDVNDEPASPAGREFTNLTGAVNDVGVMSGLLTSVYRWKKTEIVVLTNRKATRAAILKAIAEVVGKAAKDDVVLFSFSGHGSQVRNSLSDEDDKLDESIVPVDAREGARDIRDKELREAFAPLLQRGARLTIVLDSCHSGSGARGLAGGGMPRVIAADERDVRDAYRGPALEELGALILSAARDTDSAHEAPGFMKRPQGVFSWAWARAVQEALQNEPAIETFQRAAARMRLERPSQVPVIAGNASARLTRFLGPRADRARDRVTVAVRKVENGLVAIEGGWANGITERSELRPVTDPPSAVRLEVVALDGMTGCTARVTSGPAGSVQSGSLLELVAWVPPEGQRLRIWIPEGNERTVTFARSLQESVVLTLPSYRLIDRIPNQIMRWMATSVDERQPDLFSADPTVNPASTLRWDGRDWEVLEPGIARTVKLGRSPKAGDVVRALQDEKPLFIQLPIPAKIAARIGTLRGIERVTKPQDADYILAARHDCGRTEYAWIRPLADKRDEKTAVLPLRTDWHDDASTKDLVVSLNDNLRRLLRIYAWQTLPSPPEAQFNYRLSVRRSIDNVPVTTGTLEEEQPYGLVLQSVPGPPEYSKTRSIYVFVIDSYGKSVLLFPRGPIGSIENRLPHPDTAPSEIRLGTRAAFIPEPPYGNDTYFLLSTAEALPDPWILEWDGVQTRNRAGGTPLERLLLNMMSDDRSVRLLAAASPWSIERLSFTVTKAPNARTVGSPPSPSGIDASEPTP